MIGMNAIQSTAVKSTASQRYSIHKTLPTSCQLFYLSIILRYIFYLTYIERQSGRLSKKQQKVNNVNKKKQYDKLHTIP